MFSSRLQRALRDSCITVAGAAIFFLLIEGVFSTWVAIRSIAPRHELAERLHVRYDPDLGWAHVPGAHLPDLYGPGRYLRINSQGFRGDREAYSRARERGRRAICSGDSFALGYGVGNPDTWCQRLERESGGTLQTINMGQGGYGVDQAYLWYRRDARPFAHDVHLFSFTTGNFERMLMDEFSGYPKPRLAVENGRLAVRNTPVPEPGLLASLRRSPYKLLAFRSVSTLFGFSSSLASERHERQERSERQLEVVSKLFEDLAAIHRERGSALVAVHLPTRNEYRAGHRQILRAFLRKELARQRIPYWDLLEDLQALPREALGGYFIPPDDPMAERFPSAPGHYNEAGHALVAEILGERLRADGLL